MYTLFFFVALLFSVAFGTKVIDLNTADFDSVVNGEDLMLVEFFAPWCGHCKKLAPEYDAASIELSANDPPIKLAKVDCTVETELGTRFGIRGYPTLKVFRNGKPQEYSGDRTKAGIVSYMKSISRPNPVVVESESELEKLISDETILFGYFKDDASSKAFKAYADEKILKLTVVTTTNKSLAKKYLNGKKNAVAVLYHKSQVHPKYDKPSVVREGTITEEQLSGFVEENIRTFFGLRTSTNEWHFPIGRALATLYYNVDYLLDPKGTNYFRNRFAKQLTDSIKKAFVFAVGSVKEMGNTIRDIGAKCEKACLIVAKDGKNYVYDTDYNHVGAAEFLKTVLEDAAEPFLKSEAVPDSQGPVTVVVGKTFDELITKQTDKDVLIEFYAPWCGHCKSLAPIYDELGELVGDKAVIAKIDATANWYPQDTYKVTGFPTIYFKKAGSTTPEQYSGGRELKDFVKFLNDKAKLDLQLKGKKDEL